MINIIPVFGWLLSFLVSVSLAIPFYFIWNHLAPTYFYFGTSFCLHRGSSR